MELVIGEIYKVNCSRKGKFEILLTRQDETWATGMITKGKANAILEYNEREQFEDITVRKSFCTFELVKP